MIAHYFHSHAEHVYELDLTKAMSQECKKLFSQLVIALSSEDRELIKQISGAIKNLAYCDKQNSSEKGTQTTTIQPSIRLSIYISN